jgi:hypothetical protein
VQDRAPADEIPARLDRLALDKIDAAAKKRLQRVLQIGEPRKVVSGGRLEGNEEVSIAAGRIETRVARCGAEDLQPRHSIPAADRRKSIALFVNVRVHDFLPSLWRPVCYRGSEGLDVAWPEEGAKARFPQARWGKGWGWHSGNMINVGTYNQVPTFTSPKFRELFFGKA